MVDLLLSSNISQEENRRAVEEEKTQFCCKVGSLGAYISSEGEVSGCEEFAHNLREAGFDFQALWHGEKAKTYREQVGKARACRGCTLESQPPPFWCRSTP